MHQTKHTYYAYKKFNISVSVHTDIQIEGAQEFIARKNTQKQYGRKERRDRYTTCLYE